MDNARGITMMVISMALFAVEDAFIKQVSAHVPTGQILLVLGLFGGGAFVAMARARGVRLISPVLLSWPVMLRNLAEIFGTMSFVTALSLIPLSTAAAIVQATPLMMTLGAAVLLRESVGWRRWSAIAVGFAGVLLILRPGMAAFDANALFAVAGVIALAVRDMAARYVPAQVGTLQLSAYGFSVLLPAGALLLLLPGGGALVMPDGPQALLLAGAVVFGVGGYYAVTLAVRTGEVSVVTPFRYARLVFATLAGMVAFGERPDAATLVGAALIVGSGLYTLLREARLRR